MVTVKICGLTNAGDAMLAAEAGADFFGFVFALGSPRTLSPVDCTWIGALPLSGKVGVFRDQEEGFIVALREKAGLQLVQLHGSEPPELCERLGGARAVIKAVLVRDFVDWGLVNAYASVARVLFDAGAGSGRQLLWDLLRGAPGTLRFWLAGGLKPENVAKAIAIARPAGVDVSSGVESEPGRKDPVKLKAFISAVRRGSETIT